MPVTYEPIATTTLGSAAASITFSSISSAYTDLRLVIVCTMSNVGNVVLQFNSNTATNYSYTAVYGDGSTAFSNRGTSQSYLYLTQGGNTSTSIPSMYTADIFSYAGSTFKTVLTSEIEDQNGSGWSGRGVGLWRQTSAINTIDIKPLSTHTFSTGTTATLYGILKA